ncbi:Nucleotide-binding alpha-beta plait [Penicillium capsulatum]|nr:Nucleotide-binding alpha-beta plait [Penicillium capsulatum]
MNSIRQVQALNKRELENAVPPEASWHADYRDTAYIYIGGLPFDLSEGDIVTIFSQYGEPVHINLARDKETGKSRGFAFLKYEDQRSTDLAVDNMGGATILGRMLRVDHTRYKRRDDEDEDDNVAKLMGDAVINEGKDDAHGDRQRRRRSAETRERRPMLKEERELQELIQNHDEEDPMKQFLIDEKKEEVAPENDLVTIIADIARGLANADIGVIALQPEKRSPTIGLNGPEEIVRMIDPARQNRGGIIVTEEDMRAATEKRANDVIAMLLSLYLDWVANYAMGIWTYVGTDRPFQLYHEWRKRLA